MRGNVGLLQTEIVSALTGNCRPEQSAELGDVLSEMRASAQKDGAELNSVMVIHVQ